MTTNSRILATLGDGSGGRWVIRCDHRQRFRYERSRHGALVRSFESDDPELFHRYTYQLCARGWSFAWAPINRKEAPVGR